MSDINLSTFSPVNMDSQFPIRASFPCYTPSNSYFNERLVSPSEQSVIRKLPAFRLAADIVSATNKTYFQHLNHGDMRLRITGHRRSGGDSRIVLGDLMGAPIAMVYVVGDTFKFETGHAIKERGDDSHILSSQKLGVLIKALTVVRKGCAFPRLLAHMNEVWNSHSHVLMSNLRYVSTRVLSVAGLDKPLSDMSFTRDTVVFLLNMWKNGGAGTEAPIQKVVDELTNGYTTMENSKRDAVAAINISREAFGNERWCVVRCVDGYLISRMSVPSELALDPHRVGDSKFVMPFVFVHELADLEKISSDLHEQFMAAYVMMRAVETHFSVHQSMYGTDTVPGVDFYFQQTHTCSYYQSTQRFTGSVSLTFRALA